MHASCICSICQVIILVVGESSVDCLLGLFHIYVDMVRFLGLDRWKGPWGLKKAVVVGVVLVGVISIFLARGQQKRLILNQSSGCHFPAVYNFGDSNSDTGGRSAAFAQTHSPYGRTYFGKPSGRLSDGRLIIDFMG